MNAYSSRQTPLLDAVLSSGSLLEIINTMDQFFGRNAQFRCFHSTSNQTILLFQSRSVQLFLVCVLYPIVRKTRARAMHSPYPGTPSPPSHLEDSHPPKFPLLLDATTPVRYSSHRALHHNQHTAAYLMASAIILPVLRRFARVALRHRLRSSLAPSCFGHCACTGCLDTGYP